MPTATSKHAPPITHYALVTPGDNSTVRVSKHGVVTVTTQPGRIYLIPAADINRFWRKHTRAGTPGRGLNRHWPWDACGQWLAFDGSDVE